MPPANGSGPARTGTPRRTSGRCSTRGGGLPTRYRVPGRGHPLRTEPRPTPSRPPKPAPARRQLGPPRTQGGAAPPQRNGPISTGWRWPCRPGAQAGGGLAGGAGSVPGEQVSAVRFGAALGCHWRHGCLRSGLGADADGDTSTWTPTLFRCWLPCGRRSVTARWRYDRNCAHLPNRSQSHITKEFLQKANPIRFVRFHPLPAPLPHRIQFLLAFSTPLVPRV